MHAYALSAGPFYSPMRAPCPTPSPPRPAGLNRGSNLKQLQRFVKDVAQMNGVYFVTMRQLIAWMKARGAGGCLAWHVGGSRLARQAGGNSPGAAVVQAQAAGRAARRPPHP